MPQLFPRSANTLARLALPLALLVLTAAAWGWHTFIFSSAATGVGEPVAQPVPFSHEHHVGGLGIDCRYCHTGVETSAVAGIPPTETCMTCHSQVWRDAPVLAPVRASWSSGTPLRWGAVHRLPDYTYFNHSIHVAKGVACQSCHGRVDRMPLMAKAETLYMRWCLECHRAPEKHLRPADQVFAMLPEPLAHRTGVSETALDQPAPSFPAAKSDAVAHAIPLAAVARLQDCSICHR